MKIAVALNLTQSQEALLREASGGAEIVKYGQRPRPVNRFPMEMADKLADCDALACYVVPKDLPKLAPRLKFVQTMFAGAESALADEATAQSGLPIATVSGAHADNIGEYVIMSMLAFAHRLHACIRAQIRHEWLPISAFNESVTTMRGRTLGIVGYGSLGRSLARFAQGFGLKILALKRNPAEHRDAGWCAPGSGDPEGMIPQAWFGPEQRLELLARSDFIALTLPLTPATRNFIGARELAAMKPGAYLVNVGRGGLIDQDALTHALANGPLGGAGLDVMIPEPLDAGSPLWDMDNVLLTPHISGAHIEYLDRAFQIFAENLRRFRSGRALVNLVDRAAGY